MKHYRLIALVLALLVLLCSCSNAGGGKGKENVEKPKEEYSVGSSAKALLDYAKRLEAAGQTEAANQVMALIPDAEKADAEYAAKNPGGTAGGVLDLIDFTEAAGGGNK